MADIIIISILAITAFIIIRFQIKKINKGSCSGGCEGCSGCNLGSTQTTKRAKKPTDT